MNVIFSLLLYFLIGVFLMLLAISLWIVYQKKRIAKKSIDFFNKSKYEYTIDGKKWSLPKILGHDEFIKDEGKEIRETIKPEPLEDKEKLYKEFEERFKRKIQEEEEQKRIKAQMIQEQEEIKARERKKLEEEIREKILKEMEQKSEDIE